VTFTVYNTLARRKEPFEPLEPGVVRMYNCGPTVYSRAHIGNFRSYLFADTLRRWLEHEGYEVRQVMNITDVGHMTDDDEDRGEDKVEAQARRSGKDPWQITRQHTEQFLADLEALGCRRALVYPKATEHVREMLAIVEGLVESGHAYQVDGNVYFDVTRFPDYGRLSGNKVQELEAGARIAINEEKRNPEDFALWKSDPQHVMKWESRFGPHGFPGWHIECSAMAMKHLGQTLDIHTGGEDNIFPHHECEIAQSEAFSGKPFVRYWMHAKFLQVDGGKMSKSLGNVWNLGDVVERGFSPRALRFALIRGHYRQPLNFSWEILREAASALESLDDLARRLRRVAAGEEPGAPGAEEGAELVDQARAGFVEAMNDDLSTPQALSTLFVLRKHVLEGRLGSAAARRALAFLEEADTVLAVLELGEDELEEEIRRRIDERQAARARRDFAAADAIRDALLAQGIALEDTPAGVVWRRKG
jgi:cysteinyl-tRNA synthetase